MGSNQSQCPIAVNENELIQDEIEEEIEKSEIPHFDEEQKCKKITIIRQCLASCFRFPGLGIHLQNFMVSRNLVN